MAIPDYAKLVPMPAPSSVNTGVTAVSTTYLHTVLGRPRVEYTQECLPVTHPAIAAMIVRESVGPFKVTGNFMAVASLKRVMAAVKDKNPHAYAQVGTAGMLCARFVRGSKATPSRHSWGLAVDLKFNGQLDQPGNGKVQSGLLAVYGAFHAEGWYWGVEFPREDGMHFEVGAKKVREWFGHLRNGVKV